MSTSSSTSGQLNSHEIAILTNIINNESKNRSPVSKYTIMSELDQKGFAPEVTAIRLLDLEKNKTMIKIVQTDFNAYGYSLNTAGEEWAVENIKMFEEAAKAQEIPF